MKVLATLALVLTCLQAAVFKPNQVKGNGRLLRDFDSEKKSNRQLAKKDVSIKLPKYAHAGLILSSRVHKTNSKKKDKHVKVRKTNAKPERKLSEAHHGGHEEGHETEHHDSGEHHSPKGHGSSSNHNAGHGHELNHSAHHGTEEDEEELEDHHSNQLSHESVMKARINYPDLGLVNLEKGTYLFKIT